MRANGKSWARVPPADRSARGYGRSPSRCSHSTRRGRRSTRARTAAASSRSASARRRAEPPQPTAGSKRSLATVRSSGTAVGSDSRSRTGVPLVVPQRDCGAEPRHRQGSQRTSTTKTSCSRGSDPRSSTGKARTRPARRSRVPTSRTSLSRVRSFECPSVRECRLRFSGAVT